MQEFDYIRPSVDLDELIVRQANKSLRHAVMHGASTLHGVAHSMYDVFGACERMMRDNDLSSEAFKLAKDTYTEWERYLQQIWIIDGEWSQYHQLTSNKNGWGLTKANGMWEIGQMGTKFKTDEEAREHVLKAEADPQHPEHMLAKFATHALVVGNIRGS